MSMFEEIPIESIHVGDLVFIGADGERVDKAVRVLALTTVRQVDTNRVIGWLVDVEPGASVWLRRGTRVKRRRLRAVSATPPISAGRR
jgi:hypothetical protein